MVVSINVDESFPYVIKAERDLPQEQQTVFLLRPLPASVGMALDNLHEASSSGQVTLRVGDQRVVTLRAGLVGWRNLNDAKGNPVEFSALHGERPVMGIVVKNPARPEMVDLLPEVVAEELATAIRTFSSFTKDDAKN